jgi:DNA polymerase-3 subunit gamma/tau
VQDVLGAAGGESVAAIAEAISAGDAGAGMAAIQRSLDGGTDARQLARQVVEYLRGILLHQMGQADLVDAPVETRGDMGRLAGELPTSTVLAGLRSFGRAAGEARAGWQPSLGLELALMDTLQAGSPGAEHSAPPSAPRPSSTPAAPARRPSASPPTPPAPRKSGAPAAEGSVTAKAIAENWEAILEAAYRLDSRTQALLKSGKLLGVRDGKVVIGFPTEILREKMEKGHSLTHARQAMEQVLGARAEVRCVLLSHWSGEDGATSSEAMADDGMVATAVRELGGQVVAVRPAPGQETRPNA